MGRAGVAVRRFGWSAKVFERLSARRVIFRCAAEARPMWRVKVRAKWLGSTKPASTDCQRETTHRFLLGRPCPNAVALGFWEACRSLCEVPLAVFDLHQQC